MSIQARPRRTDELYAEAPMEAAKTKAKELGAALVEQAIEMALEDWHPSSTDPTEAGMEILKRGIPLLMDDLKKSGIV